MMIITIFFLHSTYATQENTTVNETSAEQNTNEVTNEITQEEPKKEIPTETSKNETMYVQERCNIRSSYSVDSERVGGLDVGTEVTVIAEYSNGWYKIEHNGVEAYIKAAILRSTPPPVEEPNEEKPEENEPINQPLENQNEVDVEYAQLINEIGVLPEVGHNLADFFYWSIIGIAIFVISYKRRF